MVTEEAGPSETGLGGAAKVTYLGTCQGNALRELAAQVDKGEVTHAVAVYRRSDGSLCYRTIGGEHQTFLVGMLSRIQTHIHCTDAFVTPAE